MSCRMVSRRPDQYTATSANDDGSLPSKWSTRAKVRKKVVFLLLRQSYIREKVNKFRSFVGLASMAVGCLL